MRRARLPINCGSCPLGAMSIASSILSASEMRSTDYEMKSVFADVESGGIFRGYAGFPFEYFKTLDDPYDQFQLAVQDFIDAGAAVLVVAHIEWRGRGSGAEGRGPLFAVLWLRAARRSPQSRGT